eukprot:7958974-Prorocentrum_lima.AAC.1
MWALWVEPADEAPSNEEEAASEEACCSIWLFAKRPGGPMFIRGIAFMSSVVGNWLTLGSRMITSNAKEF